MHVLTMSRPSVCASGSAIYAKMQDKRQVSRAAGGRENGDVDVKRFCNLTCVNNSALLSLRCVYKQKGYLYIVVRFVWISCIFYNKVI